MTQKKFEFILAASAKGFNSINRARQGLQAFNKEVGNGNTLMAQAKAHVAGLVGAYLGFNLLSSTVNIIKEANSASFELESSLEAANREFDKVGSMETWGKTVDSLSEKLRIYSKTDIRSAAAQTIDMTKRLGLSAEQMEIVIARTADLSAGKTTLLGGIERVTAALRGEAEASEYLGLTLNENYVKAWYEASGATQGAWKNLDDLQKAQVRYMVFLEQANSKMGRAAESVKTFAGAYDLVKAKLTDAVTENEKMVDVMKDLAEYLEANANDIGELVSSIAQAAAEAAKWTVENKELVATLGKWAFAIYGVTTAGGILIRFLKGFNAAAAVITGSSLIAWFGKLRGVITGVTLGMGAMAAVTASVAVAFVNAVVQSIKLYDRWKELKKIQKEIEEQTKENAEANKRLADRFAEISKETGVTVTSIKELDDAVKKGLLRFDEVSGDLVKGYQNVAEAAEQSGKKQADSVQKVTDEMLKKYKKYAENVKRLQQELAGMEQSLAERLRAMSRTGMSDLGAWRDRKKEAEKYMKTAQQAAEAGDMKKAVEFSKKAEDAYADLNREVKNGETVAISQQAALKTAMEGVRAAGEQAAEYQRKIIEQEQKAAEALNKSTGGKLLEALKKDAPELASVFDSIKSKVDEMSNSADSYARVVVPEIGKAYELVFDNAEKKGKAAIKTIDIETDKLVKKKREMEINIKLNGPSQSELDRLFGDMKGVVAVAGKAKGGFPGLNPVPWVPGFNTGGGVWAKFQRLANPLIMRGSGMKDDVPAMLKKHEFVQPTESVKLYGVRFMEMVRRGLFPVELARGFATGGTPAGPVSLAGAVSAGGSSVYNLTVNYSGSGSHGDARVLAKTVLSELQKMQRGSSR
ncbi:phage tail tape measure protein [Desulforhopalus singaporensis]|uniref:Uncharacterized protein n=1 Tax=Desulforhopalus singaporensis TaxID=91360 RepID=A0A1H0UVG3_9BACT|nr:hypothetical protein [Desulforhopalus singaporensis]SDP69766.1 hypothetical protein SAMN05660330_03722 [Desulforhopalus singaporensis]